MEFVWRGVRQLYSDRAPGRFFLQTNNFQLVIWRILGKQEASQEYKQLSPEPTPFRMVNELLLND